MDNPADSTDTRSLRWSPAPGLVTVAWLGVAVFGVLALAPDLVDLRGRLLSGLAAGALLVVALIGTLARPRLAADSEGVATRGVTGGQRYPWSSVQRVHVVRTPRFGRQVSTLEIDATTADGAERLLVFGRLELGADPEDVSEQLNRLAGEPPR